MPRTAKASRAFTPEDVRSMARGLTAPMLNVLKSIALQKTAPAAARVAAANSVLERGWGKAQQEISSKSELTIVIRKLMHEEPLTIEHERAPGSDVSHAIEPVISDEE